MRVQPRRVRIETSTYCRLRCPSCPTTEGLIEPALGRGMLKLADFQSLLVSSPWIREVEVSNYGEPLLNPAFVDILKFAAARGVAVTVENGTTLNGASSEVLEALVKYRVRRIVVSIDGASEQTYKQYRIRGSFEAVIANLKKINHWKSYYRCEEPDLIWQFLIFGDNEHEIPEAKRMARELRMSFFPKLSWDETRSPVRDAAFVKRETGLTAVSRTEFRDRAGAEYLDSICTQLWTNPQINWDGAVLGCCRNFWGGFGANAFGESAVDAINSEPMQYARDMLSGTVPERADIPCTTCAVYQQRKTTGRWVRVHTERTGRS